MKNRRLCERCGEEIVNRHSSATLCWGCVSDHSSFRQPRLSAHRASSNSRSCAECGMDISDRRQNAHFCEECAAERKRRMSHNPVQNPLRSKGKTECRKCDYYNKWCQCCDYFERTGTLRPSARRDGKGFDPKAPCGEFIPRTPAADKPKIWGLS